ncbi:LuxR family two component transcriptional regulator [Alteromonas sp. 76-1]|jgi:DNA-binding NarL/FixJ family response regulator|uniref:Two component LuxR family transcriptional regulator n=1 Tax=Alteromonas naphthalenivorans TaxID=715451 RepID=F5ZA90_ALTNA|nr:MULTISPECIES: response regulator transcription factor [Alteromonas]AEF01781.1 two component LuxR family transcriptional regulator [Alteromonas naphthalenivorans]MBB67145.1 DNA-binding response regulator [Rickettsiales bacterium]MBO7924208.1 response regulator transcription factor [Alteromonas sp. K632G]VEL98387.1 LuxR family two component transcriptional regulator [Alteromonas sp. 76-1]|tara:strand:+ start:4721 stop:5380 length:660 start_codon:yes stop_codon:yes gene_type:complete
MQRILIIDDHPIFRHAMVTILGKKFPDSQTIEANSLSEALEVLEADAAFDLVMLDLNMPETCGLNGLLEIRNQHPNLPVVIISAETEKHNILQTISYGAVGFISKSSKIEEIATSVESIFEGNVCLPSEILRTSSTRNRVKKEDAISLDQIRSLTRKELAVLKYLTQGLANKVIAYELNISETTVKSHVSSILKKLGASNRVKVVASAANIDFNQYVFN